MGLPRVLITAAAVLVLLTGCGKPPGLEAGAPLTPSDQPIGLLPLDEVLAQANRGVVTDASAAALAARAARLRARAGIN